MEQAARLASMAGDSAGSDTCNMQARVCLDIAQIKLVQTDQVLKVQQLDLTREANGLSEKILKSNEEASKQNAEYATSMNKATRQLANSTKWLTVATCGLVLFAAVQAFIAFLALYKK